MLVFKRRVGQTIVIGDDIVVTVVNSATRTLRIGVDAPDGVRIDRGEVRARIADEEVQPDDA